MSAISSGSKGPGTKRIWHMDTDEPKVEANPKVKLEAKKLTSGMGFIFRDFVPAAVIILYVFALVITNYIPSPEVLAVFSPLELCGWCLISAASP